MTRREFEMICRVLRECRSRTGVSGVPASGVPAVPSAEWMRRYIARALCEALWLTGDSKRLFLTAAGVTDAVIQGGTGDTPCDLMTRT